MNKVLQVVKADINHSSSIEVAKQLIDIISRYDNDYDVQLHEGRTEDRRTVWFSERTKSNIRQGENVL